MRSPLQPGNRSTRFDLDPGTIVDIVKLAPDGQEVTRYPGRVISCPYREWMALEANWTRQSLEIAGLVFATGDRLIECFSAQHPFDAFAVESPDGKLRGWYANVTWPSWIEAGNPPNLYWHDLYVDLIALPDGQVTILDEDELEDAAVENALKAMIAAARDELLARFERREMPFSIWWK